MTANIMKNKENFYYHRTENKCAERKAHTTLT